MYDVLLNANARLQSEASDAKWVSTLVSEFTGLCGGIQVGAAPAWERCSHLARYHAVASD